MRIPLSIRTRYYEANHKRALVDSGATDNFIHPRLATRMQVGQQAFDKPKKIFNIDNTENKLGSITHFMDLKVQTKGEVRDMCFLIADIGSEDLLLGYTWLTIFELGFKWKPAIMDHKAFPVIISSTIPSPHKTIIAHLTDKAKQDIVHELSTLTTIKGIAMELAIQAGEGKKKVEILKCYAKFSRLFSEEASHQFPLKRPWDHAIEFKPDTPDVINCKIYPMMQTEDEALKEFVQEQHAKGYICPSKSPYTSPFFFIKKRDGKLRPVQDYRCINNHTIRNQYLLPLISELIANLSSAHIFSKLDVRWGYNNVRIKEGDEHKAAFKTKYGLWEPTVMFFGLTNSLATFQAMMDSIYRPVVEKWAQCGTCIEKYMDDITIATSTNEADHTEAVMDVLQVTEDHDLYFKPEKCVFHASHIDYLGVIFEKGMIRMDPVKIEGIKNWPTPTKVKDVRSFLGFCNFYRPFIPKCHRLLFGHLLYGYDYGSE